MDNKILIATMGNPFSGDDGVGQTVLAAFMWEGLPRGVKIVDLGSDSTLILRHYQGEDCVIFVDAINMEGKQPGEVVVMDLSEIKTGISRSAHQMDPIEGITLSAMTDERLAKAEKLLVGIQVESVGMGPGITRSVMEGASHAALKIRALIREKLG